MEGARSPQFSFQVARATTPYFPAHEAPQPGIRRKGAWVQNTMACPREHPAGKGGKVQTFILSNNMEYMEETFGSRMASNNWPSFIGKYCHTFVCTTYQLQRTTSTSKLLHCTDGSAVNLDPGVAPRLRDGVSENSCVTSLLSPRQKHPTLVPPIAFTCIASHYAM